MPRSARPGGYPPVNDFWSKLNTGIGRNSNALIGLGTGLLSAPSFDQGLAAGGQGFMQGAQVDSAYRVAEEEKAARAAQINQTAQYLAQTFPDLAEAVNAGMPLDAAWNEAMKRSQPGYGQAGGDPFTLGPGQVRYGADGKPIAQGPAQSPENIFNIGENTSAFTKKADELAAGRMSEIVTAGQGAQSFMGDINALAEIGKTLQTGKRAEAMAMVGPFAEAIGIDIEGLGEAEAYEAIIARMAPAMRPPGSGASSDFDAKQFLRSLPALGNSPEGNAIIEQTFTALQQNRMAAMDIANRALSGEISWNEADKRIANLGDPFTAFNDYRAKTKGGNKDAAMSSGNGWKVISVE
jgi:hypothetical protein